VTISSSQLLVVSEPLDDGARCWSPIESNSLIQFDRNNAMTIQTIIEMTNLEESGSTDRRNDGLEEPRE